MPSAQSPNRKRTVFVWAFAVAALLLLIATRTILLPFILALVIAYVLTPAVSIVERARIPRWIGVLIVYVITLGTAYGFFSIVTPRLVHETIGLRRELPGLSMRVRDQWVPAVYSKLRSIGISDDIDDHEPDPTRDLGRDTTVDGLDSSEGSPMLRQVAPTSTTTQPHGPAPALRFQHNPDGSYDVIINTEFEVRNTDEHTWRVTPVDSAEPATLSVDLGKLLSDGIEKAVAYGQKNIVEVLRFGSSIVASVSRSVFLFFLTLMLAAYIMISREKLFEFFRVLVHPSRQQSFDIWVKRVDRGLAGVVRGQLLICVVNGVLSAIGFALIGLKYWPILSVVACVMSVIPIFGSILSSIPAVAIGLTQGVGTGVATLVWIVGIHQVEANLLNPKIYGMAAKIHPVLVIFSLLVGEHFFGLAGALLAVPCMSIVQNTFVHFRQEALGEHAPADTFVSMIAERQALVESAGDAENATAVQDSGEGRGG